MNSREGGGDNLVSDIQLFTLEILFVQNFPQFEAQTFSSIYLEWTQKLQKKEKLSKIPIITMYFFYFLALYLN